MGMEKAGFHPTLKQLELSYGIETRRNVCKPFPTRFRCCPWRTKNPHFQDVSFDHFESKNSNGVKIYGEVFAISNRFKNDTRTKKRREILSNEVSDAKETFIIVVLVPVKINRYIIMARISGENDK